MSGLAYHDPSSMIGCIPLGVHYRPASMGINIMVPLPYVHVPSEVCSHIMLPEVFTHPQWMLLVDIHGRSLQLPIFPPQGSFPGRSLGDHLTTFLLWHPLSFTSHRGSLPWGGAGTTVPVYDGCPYTRECQSLTWQQEVSFGGGLHDLPCWFVTL